ncbi:hypothetical protein CDD83_7507 [Cordyceps sp. RAO-2017]|nr:hypothetical protein CDD83_7507 [Cordyceps sp. RAO-2017]
MRAAIRKPLRLTSRPADEAVVTRDDAAPPLPGPISPPRERPPRRCKARGDAAWSFRAWAVVMPQAGLLRPRTAGGWNSAACGPADSSSRARS